MLRIDRRVRVLEVDDGAGQGAGDAVDGLHLRDDQLEDGFKLLGDPRIVEIISKHGDIDYPSKLAKMLFKKVPQLLKFARPYLRSFF